VNTVRVDVVHEVLTANLLTPVVTVTTLQAILQPERVVVVTIGTSLTATIVAIEVSITSTSDRAHRDPFGVELSVDFIAGDRSLKQALVLDSVGDDVDLDLFVRESIIAVKPLEPFLVLSIVGAGDLGTLGFGDGGAGVPPNTDIKVTLICHDLVETSVDIGIDSTIVGLLVVLPYLLERSLEICRRVPARLALYGTVSRHLRESALDLWLGKKSLPDRTVEGRLGGRRGDNATEDGGESRDTHSYGIEMNERLG